MASESCARIRCADRRAVHEDSNRVKARSDQEASSLSNPGLAGAPRRRRAWAGRCVLAALLGAVVAAPAAPAPTPTSADSVSALGASVREWLALRREWRRLRSDWQDEQRLLADEERLLQERVAGLRSRIARTDVALASEERALSEFVAARRGVTSSLASAAASVGAAELHLGTWFAKLPSLLQQPLRDSFLSLPQDADPNVNALAERAQRVVAIYTELQQLSRGIHAGRMVLPDAAGQEREVDVLFIGIAVGYALAADTDTAAVGRPTVAGWSWQWRPELAAPVRRLFECHRRESSAALVSVPVRRGESPP